MIETKTDKQKTATWKKEIAKRGKKFPEVF